MIRVAHPLAEDVAYIARQMRPDEVDQYCAFTGGEYDADEAIRRFLTIDGPKFVITADHMPVVIGGFYRVRPGVWEGWQAGTMAGWGAHWRAITKHTRRLNDALLQDPSCHRLQLCAVAGRDKTFEWYERSLGYTREAVLKGYCADGRDAVMFARVKGD